MSDKVFFNTLITKSLTVSKDNQDRFFTGILTVQMKDVQGEILIIDELMKVLPIWMKRGAPLSDTHSNRIVGKGINYQRLKIKDKDGHSFDAVEITGIIYKDYRLDDDIWEKMKSGEYRGLSFGGATKSDREATKWIDGSLAYNLKDLEHYEVAVCKDPAVPLALFTDVQYFAKSLKMTDKHINYTKRGEQVVIQCTNFGCFVEKAEEYEEEKKLSQVDAGYVALKEKSPHCGACIYYRENRKCTRVSGDIDPDHGCCIIFKGDKSIYKSISNINKPFAGYKDFDACVSANSNKGDPQAYCATIMRQVEGVDKVSVKPDPSEEDMTPGTLAISPTGKSDDMCIECGGIHKVGEQHYKGLTNMGKGMVEDHADLKCPHCGYTPSSGEESMDQHMALSHPEKLESMGMQELQKDPEKENTKETDSADLESDGLDLEDVNNQPKPGEKPQTHQGTADDIGNELDYERNVPNQDVPVSTEPEKVGDIMVETPVATQVKPDISGIQQPNAGIQSNIENKMPGNQDPKQQDPRADGEFQGQAEPQQTGYPDTRPPLSRDANNTETEGLPGASGGSGRTNTNIDSDTQSSYDKYGTGYESVRNEDQNLNNPERTDEVDEKTKAEDGAKIKLEGESAKKLLETAGILPTDKDGVRSSGHKQYSNPHGAESAQVSVSSDTAFDPNTSASNYQSGETNMRAFKSYTDLMERLKQRVSKEEVSQEDVIAWWNVMNPSQRQHALDPNNWYTWSDDIARKNFEQLDDEGKQLALATYAFRNDGKTVENMGIKQLVPASEGSPQTEGVGANKADLDEEADTRNINTTPTPMTATQNTQPPNSIGKRNIDIRNLNILETELRLKSILRNIGKQ